MFENLFKKKNDIEREGDLDNILVYNLMFKETKNYSDFVKLCVDNKKKCLANEKAFCKKAIELLGYTIPKDTDVVKIYKVLMRAVKNPDKFIKEADKENQDVKNFFDIKEKKSCRKFSFDKDMPTLLRKVTPNPTRRN